MNPLPTQSTLPAGPPSPADVLGRQLRWLFWLALSGLAALALLLGFAVYTAPTVLVPDRGGVFREGVVGVPQFLHPVWCQGTVGVDGDLCALLYRGLMRLDANGRVVPDLAEAWEVSDNRIYRFRLKANLFWHDGQPITADDAYFSFTQLQEPSLADVPGLSSFWRSIQVEKLDERTLQITLPQPFAPFIDLMTLGLLPEHLYQGIPALELVTRPFTSPPVGAGPMRIVETSPQRVRLEPSPFNGGSPPYITALEFWSAPDYASMVAAFDAQQLDGLSTILPVDVQAALGRRDLQIFSSVESSYEHVLLNLNNPNTPFFQDRRLRQALLYAVKRSELVTSTLSGQGLVADGLFSPNHWAYAPAATTYPFDPARAASLLTEAGWLDRDGDGVREQGDRKLAFILLVKDDLRHQEIGAHLAADWAQVGVQAQVQPVSFSGLVTDFLGPRTFEAALIDWKQTGDPDPFPQWHSSQSEGSGQNYSGWRNETIDQLLEEARQSTDEAIRQELYARFQSIYAQELPSLPLFFPFYTYGVSTRVRNVRLEPINSPTERFGTFSEWSLDSRRVPASQAPAAPSQDPATEESP
ncbi:MAG: ABC transporter substrate-binding protein [Caldilinea sp.]